MRRRSLADDHERHLDEVHRVLDLIRCLSSLGRWDGSLDEWRHVEAMAREGVALVVGSRSEAIVSGAKARRRQRAGGIAR
jgi:hypothetical protein